MKKPKKSDFKNCIDPEFAYINSVYWWMLQEDYRKNPLLKLLKK